MQEIVFQLEDSSSNIQYYCIVDYNKLHVVPSKSFEKRIFWNEFKDYELKNGKIFRVNNYKDNVLSRLLGLSEKNRKSFDTDTDIGSIDFDYFSTGCICISIQKIYQDGLDYTCDFVACCTDTINLFNFYNRVKSDTLVWSSSPYHLRGRCSVSYLTKELPLDFFLSVSYILRRRNYMYIEDKEIYEKYLEHLRLWCILHNEELFLKYNIKE